jgi:vacuolar-type H+-ATPase subunit E/Vma4
MSQARTSTSAPAHAKDSRKPEPGMQQADLPFVQPAASAALPASAVVAQAAVPVAAARPGDRPALVRRTRKVQDSEEKAADDAPATADSEGSATTPEASSTQEFWAVAQASPSPSFAPGASDTLAASSSNDSALPVWLPQAASLKLGLAGAAVLLGARVLSTSSSSADPNANSATLTTALAAGPFSPPAMVLNYYGTQGLLVSLEWDEAGKLTVKNPKNTALLGEVKVNTSEVAGKPVITGVELNFASYTGPLLVVLLDQNFLDELPVQYHDEVAGLIPLESALRAVTVLKPGQNQLAITPLTELALQLAQAPSHDTVASDGSGYVELLKDSERLTDIQQAKQNISNTVGLDIAQVLPTAVNDVGFDRADAQARAYGQMLASVSNLVPGNLQGGLDVLRQTLADSGSAASAQLQTSLEKFERMNNTLLVERPVPQVVLDPVGNGATLNAADSQALNLSGRSLNAPAGSVVRIFVEDAAGKAVIFRALVDDAGQWSVKAASLSGLADGSLTVRAFIVDKDVIERTLRLDTTPPVRPSAGADLSSSSDTGASATDNITANNRPGLLVGTPLPPGVVQVELLVGGLVVPASYDPSTGILQPSSPLPDGNHSITYRFIDDAGNRSQDSQAINLSIDTSAPAGVSITSASATAIAGRFDGTATLALSIAGQPVTGSITTDANGNWSYVPTAAELAVLRAAGAKELVLTATDVAGNSARDSRTVTADEFSGPHIKELIPADGGVLANSRDGSATVNLVFSKAVSAATGVIKLFDASNNTLVTSIDVASDAVTIESGRDVFVTLPGLTLGRQYYVTIDAGSFVDAGGEAFAGLSSTTGWDFTAVAASIAPDFVAGDDVINASENGATVQITGTVVSSSAILEDISTANLSMTVSVPTGQSVVTATLQSYDSATGRFVFSVPANAWAEGIYGYTVSLTGTAGDASGITASYQFSALAVDLTAPTMTASTGAAQDDVGRITGNLWAGSTVEAVTDDTSPAISGTLSAALSGDARVVIYRQDVTDANNPGALVRLSGPEGLKPAGTSWSLADTGLLDGRSYRYHAFVEDAAGNRSSAGSAKTLVIDTSAPQSGVTAASLSADTGSSSTDWLTNVASQSITGTLGRALGAGERLQGSLNGGISWQDIGGPNSSAVSGTSFTWSGVTLQQGTGSVQLRVVDGAGNAGPLRSYSYTLDTSAPGSPTTPADLPAGNDTGSSATDNITANNRPGLLVGTPLPPGVVQVELLVGGLVVPASYDPSTGILQPNSPLPDGNHSITYRFIDDAGNRSQDSRGLVIIIDSTAPNISITSASATAIAGRFDGTATLALSIAGQPVTGSITTDANGNWSYVPTAAELAVLRAAGAKELVLTATDVAGNSARDSRTVTADEFSGPHIKELIPADGGVLANSRDGSATVNLVFSKAVSAATGVIKLFDASNNTLVTSIDVASDAVTIESGRDVFVTLPGLTLGRQYYVTIDAGSFVDAGGEAFAGLSSTTGWDFTAVAASIAPDFVAGDDVINASENGATVQITGTVVSSSAILEDISTANLSMTVSVPTGQSVVTATLQSYDSATGRFVFSVPANAWAEGIYGYTVSLTGTAGDASGITASYQFSALAVDLTAPTMTASTGAAQDDVGRITGNLWAGSTVEAVTDDTSPAISGTLSAALSGDARVVIYRQDVTDTNNPGALVRLSGPEGLKPAGTSWSLADTGLLDGRSYRYHAFVEDAAGNRSSAGSAKTLVIDTSAPQSGVTAASLSADTGSSSTDWLTNVASQSITGTLGSALGAGERLQGSLNGGISWQDIGGPSSSAVSGTSFTWSGVTLQQGTGSVQLRVVDGAGNAGPLRSYSYTLDTSAPGSPTTPADLPAGNDTGSSATDNITANNRPGLLVGTPLPPGVVQVELLVGGLVVPASYDPSTGILQPSSPLPDGNHSITYRFIDDAGNRSQDSEALNLRIDITAPSRPTTPADLPAGNDTGSSATDNITANNRPGLLVGTPLPPGVVQVELLVGGLVVPASYDPSTGILQPSSPLPDGNHSITYRFIDDAGNRSQDSQAINLSIDTSAPAGVSITSASATAIAGRFDGTATLALSIAGQPVTGSITTDANGNWSYVPTAAELAVLRAAGAKELVLTATDVAGNSARDSRTVTADEFSGPHIKELIPADGGVLANSRDGSATVNLVFSKAVSAATGVIKLFDASNNTLVTSIDVASDAVTIESGRDVFVTLPGLTLGRQYYVTIDAGSFVDAGGEAFAGLSSTTGWDFTAVAASIAPDFVAGDDVINASENGATVQITGTVVSSSAILEDISTANLSMTVSVPTGQSVVTATLQSYDSATGRFVFSVPANAWAEGIYGYTVSLTGTAGDASGITASYQFSALAVDLTAPTMTASTGAAQDDVGRITGNLWAGSTVEAVTDDTSPAISGTLSAALSGDARVVIYRQDVTDANNPGALVRLSGPEGLKPAGTSWSLADTGLLDGRSYRYHAFVEDAAGNRSSAGSAKTLVIDTSAPQSGVTAASLSADTGSSSTDWLTNVASQSITGTLGSALGAGERLQGSLNGGISWQDIGGPSSSAVSGTSFTWSGVTLQQGTGSVQLRVVDGAGNAGPLRSYSYTLDTSAPGSPTTPADLPAGNDTGSSATDNITANNRPGLLVGTPLPPGVVQVELLVGGLVVPASYDPSTGILQPSSPLPDGNHSITYRFIDDAGNRSQDSEALNLRIDITAPSRPTTPADLPAGNDTGSSATDNITANNRPGLLVGTPLPPGVVQVELLVGGLVVPASYDPSTGILQPSSPLPDGNHSITYRFIDDAGNRSQDSQAINLSIDTSAPAGVSITSASATAIAGRFDGTATLALSIAGQPVTGSITTDANGNWSYVPTAAELAVLRAAGAKELVLTATDVAGNSARGSRTVTADEFSGPHIKELIPADGGVLANSRDGSATVNLVFSKAVSAATGVIKLFDASNNTLVTSIDVASDAVTIESGRDVFVTLPGLTLGRQYYVTIDAGSFVDAGGEAFAGLSSTTGWDFTAVAASIAPDFVAGDDVINASENGATVQITGTVVSSSAILEDISTANLSMTVSVPTGQSVVTATLQSYDSATGRFVFSVPANAWAEGIYGYTVSLTGTAGDASGITASYQFSALAVDLTAPTMTASTGAAQDDVGRITGNLWAGSTVEAVTDDTSPAISGTLSAALSGDARVVIYRQDVTDTNNPGALVRLSGPEGLKPAGTSWSLADTGLLDGRSYRYHAFVEDAAGNRSSAGSAKTLVIDTSAPQSGVTAASLSADTGSSSTDWLTNVASQSITGTLGSALGAGERLQGSLNGGISWQDIGGPSSSAVSGTSFTWSGVTLQQGTGSVQLRVVDGAGNAGPLRSYSYTLDTSAPGSPTTPADLPAGNDTGSSATDNITANNRPGLLVGTPLPPGVVQVELLVGGLVVPASYDPSTGILQPSSPLPDGNHSITYRFIDDAGNRSQDSRGLVIIIDSTAPGQPTVNVASLSAADPKVLTGSATLTAGETLSVTVNGATYRVQPDQSTRAWSLNLGTATPSAGSLGALEAGQSYEVIARATDVAGNTRVDGTSQELTLSRPIPRIDLSAIASGSGGFVINGQSLYDESGISVSSAGDVNGDGLADLLVGASGSDPAAGANAGRSYVVFGKTSTSAIALSAIAAGSGGFVINGQGANDWSGSSVAAAGDVNLDGLADLIVGAYGSDPSAGNVAGRSYVIFGKTSGAAVDLSAVAGGTGGFVINGQGASDASGRSVSSAGDVNGDGLIDFLVGASDSSTSMGDRAGRSYVVFGKTSTSAIDLSAIAAGSGGFVINGQGASDWSGSSVAAAGDVNLDGLADLIVGAYGSDRSAGNVAGRSYVIFGKTSGAAVDLSAVAGGTGGFVINGQCAGDKSGISVSSAGDVNGDGLADVIVGAMDSSPPGRSSAGRSYVVFGKSSGTAVDLSALATGSGGFVINGQCAYDSSGISVSFAGDFNGDGLADLIVGANLASPASGWRDGRSYLVFGKTSGTEVNLSAVAMGSGGFVINGQAMNDFSGRSVSAAGDINGDGLVDLLVGAPGSDPSFFLDAGRSYVVFGSATGERTGVTIDQMGTSGADTLSDGGTSLTLVGHAGNDTLTATAASVLYGGSGDDRLVIGQAMITALQSPMGAGGNSTRLARIDGGSGRDTLVLQGAGLTLDLTQVASQAASNPDGGSRVDSIEIIDLTGAGNNTLKLSLNDVLDLASANTFQATGRRQLLVRGDAGDQLDFALGSSTASWTQATSPVTLDGASYAVWNHATARASVYVQNGVGVTTPRSADMIALDTIQAAAQANNASASAPAVSVYADAGVTGVTADNLLVINNLLNTSAINGAAVDTAAKVQALVNAYNTVLAAADGNADSDTGASQAQYQLLGLTGLNTASTALLGSVVDRSTNAAADTVAELQALTDAARAVMTGAGGGPAPTLAQLQALGIVGATSDNLSTVQQALAASADDGSAVDTYAKLQALVTRAVTPPGIQLSSIPGGTGGFVINGQCASDKSGISVSSAGDVNGDGLPT